MPLDPVTVTLTADSTLLNLGDSTTLRWVVTGFNNNADTLTLTPIPGGFVAGNQPQTWLPEHVVTPAYPTTYTVVATRAQDGSTATASVFVDIRYAYGAIVTPDVTTRATAYFLNGANFPAGEYKIAYVNGAYMDIPSHAADGLYGQYYQGGNFDQLIFSRVDSTIDFDWGSSGQGGGINPLQEQAVRWTGFLIPRYSETYTFESFTDDGTRLTVNGSVLFDFFGQGHGTYSGTVNLIAGVCVPILLEYYGNAIPPSYTHLSWSSTSQAKEIVPQSQLYSNSSWRFWVGQPVDIGYYLVNSSGSTRLPQSTIGYPLQSDAEGANAGNIVTIEHPGGTIGVCLNDPVISCPDNRPGAPSPTWAISTPPIVYLVPLEAPVIAGSAATLRYGTNAVSSVIDQGIGSVASPNGNISISPTRTTVYTLTGTSPGFSDVTASVSVTVISLAPPTQLMARRQCSGSIHLKWNAPLQGVYTGFNVARGISPGGPYVLIGTTTDTAYDDVPGGSPWTPYYYIVSTVNNGAQSIASSEVSEMVPAAPVQITGLTITPAVGALIISATSDIHASTYNVYASSTPADPFAKMVASGLTTPSFPFNGLGNVSSALYITMSGVNPCGEGARSAESSGIPIAPPTGASAWGAGAAGGNTWNSGR